MFNVAEGVEMVIGGIRVAVLLAALDLLATVATCCFLGFFGRRLTRVAMIELMVG